jgi:hypothetical protein
MSRPKRPYLIAGLLPPLLLGHAIVVCGDILPSNPDPWAALVITWLTLSGAASAFIIARYLASELSPERPGVARDADVCDVWKGTICGTAVPAEQPFRGPDGRPCLAALRIGKRGAEQNRWSPFWVATGRDRVLLRITTPTLRNLGATSWRRVALRPRWFSRGAWAPELAAGERLDWACVREGDLVRVTCVGMVWANGVEPVADEAVASDGSPYRDAGRDFEVELRLRGEEHDYAVVEIVHPTMDVVWRRGDLLRIASIIAAILVGCMLWCWASYVSVTLGTLHPLRIALMVVGTALFLVPIGAWVSRGYLHAWSSDAPPPWMPGGKAEVLADAVERSWVDLAVRLRWWLGGAAGAVAIAVASAVFGFTGFVAVAGVVTLVGFAYAVLGARSSDG